jgi:hypothetical protein
MIQLEFKKSGKINVAYCNKVRVGYTTQNDDRLWYWELTLLSDQMQGYPRGLSSTGEQAKAEIERYFQKWCLAAGLKDIHDDDI